jgi:hypothetical protein
MSTLLIVSIEDQPTFAVFGAYFVGRLFVEFVTK